MEGGTEIRAVFLGVFVGFQVSPQRGLKLGQTISVLKSGPFSRGFLWGFTSQRTERLIRDRGRIKT